MSLVDTMGPFVAWCLLGFSGVIAASGFVWFLKVHAADLISQTASRNNDTTFIKKSADLVSDLIAEDAMHPGTVPAHIMDQVWKLRNSTGR